MGHVHVKHADITVRADKLNLVYGTDNKPETALFSGNVFATQFDNMTEADNMIYSLSTQRLQATGNVRSKVIQKNTDDPKKGGPSSHPGSTPDEVGVSDDQPIFITADAQDYGKDSGHIAANGNVRVKYGDTVGYGPKAVLIRDEQGIAQRVIFTGRSQISQPGKRWIGDRITLTVHNKKVLAEGNTKAIVLPSSPQKQQSDTTAQPARTENGHWPSTHKTRLQRRPQPRIPFSQPRRSSITQ